VKTASPGPIFSAIRGIINASVPEAQVTHSLTPTYFASFDSNLRTSLPRIKSALSKIDKRSLSIDDFIN